MLKVLKRQHPYMIFVIPLIAILAWSRTLMFNTNAYINFNGTMPFYEPIIHFIPKNSILSSLIAITLITIEAFIIIRLNFQYMFLNVRTYLPAVFFVLICSMYLPLQTLHPILIGNLFFLLAFDKSLTSNKNRNLFSTYFISGFLLSIGSLFYFNLIFLIPIIWISQIILRGFNLREWFISIVGFATPYFFLLFYYFYFDKLDVFNKILSQNLFFSNNTLSFNIYYLILFSYLGVLILISSLHLLSNFNTKKIITRKYFRVLFWLFLLSSILLIILNSISIEFIVIIALPISFLLSNFFVSIKSRFWGEVLFILLFLLIALALIT